jgi:hypothetical protein
LFYYFLNLDKVIANLALAHNFHHFLDAIANLAFEINFHFFIQSCSLKAQGFLMASFIQNFLGIKL